MVYNYIEGHVKTWQLYFAECSGETDNSSLSLLIIMSKQFPLPM